MGKKRIGQRFVSNEGYVFVIVEYNGSNDVLVEFQDEFKARIHTKYRHCKECTIKNPYHPSVYGVGCLGVGDFKTKVNGKVTREYALWHRMLKRCYSGKYPTYKGCKVCDRWLVYTNFLEDLPLIEGYELWRDNPNQRIALDKDIKQVGMENKVYSLETVKFVTCSENVIEMNERNTTKVVCVETKQVFDSIKEAKQWLGKGNINTCLTGKIKSAGGHHWMYLDDYKRQLRKQSDINNSMAA